MKPEANTIQVGDVLEVLRSWPDELVNCVVTSPPYWGLRDYGVAGQLGLEKTPEEFIAKMVDVFREVRRVLRKDGTCWVNMGDSYCSGSRTSYDEDPKNPVRSHTKRPGAGNRAGHRSSFRRDRLERQDEPHKGAPGIKPKDLVGIPWMLAFALRADGWYLRQDIIWAKPNPMPESVRDRCTKAHEYVFLLAKSGRYFYDAEAILEPVSPNTHMRLSQDLANQIGSHRANGGGKTNGPMKAVGRKAKMGEVGVVKSNPSFEASVCLPVSKRNKRSVWTITTKGFSEAHFATFPEELPRTCILAGCPEGGLVLDPFMGAGTTGLVALKLGRRYLGIELNPNYAAMAEQRIEREVGLLRRIA